MLNKLKSQKGITGIDVTVSIIIIMMFISIIATLSINVSSSLASKRRLEIATNCMTEIMEILDSMNYTNVEDIDTLETIKTDGNYDENSLKNEIKNILNKKNEKDELLYEILTVSVKVENYKSEGETADLVKKVTVKIIYKLNNKDEVLEVTRLKTRYNVNLEERTTAATN